MGRRTGKAASPEQLPHRETASKLLAESRARLADRLAELRRARGWTLDQAAAATGVSRASLSKLEKGQMSPTFDVLMKLGMGFDLSPSALLAGARGGSASGRRSITRAGEGTPYASPNYAHRLLAAELNNKAMLPFVTVVTARSLDDYADWDRHESEDFLYVLKGRMVLHTEHYAPVRLGPGDSLYMDGRMGHAMVSLGKTDAVILWVSAT